MSGACPGIDELVELVEGRASAALRAAIEQHASRCVDCRRLLSSLAREHTPATARELIWRPQIAPGDRIGRYIVRARLGAGGMGVVYAARDPELDRDVAIKVLAPHHAHDERRLLREARTLAQLAHPNVVAIHDVGRVGDQVFLAMELVEGDTLAHACRGAPVGAILEWFVAAGRGLAAAHAAGIVHRDFKPENVMLGNDGRVRVVDFGLARADAARDAAVIDVETTAAPAPDTATGTVMGTPHYMAPELHRGEPADARSDQFAFCVALYVGLTGVRPFAGDDLASLARAVAAGPPRRHAGERVPRRVTRALRRGLSADRADRFATMAELLAQIAPRRSRAAPIGAVLAAVAVVVAAWPAAPASPPCEDMARHLAGVWDPARRAELARVVRATGAPFADATAQAIATRLDDYATRWIAARADTCTATRVYGDQTEAAMGARLSCLDDRLRETGALVGALGHADRASLARAVAAVDRLGDPATCTATRYHAKPPLDPTRVDTARARLAEARALEETGRYREARTVLVETAPLVAAADDRPLEAEAALLEGTLADDLGELAAAGALERAVLAAEACGYDDIALRALIRLVHLHGARARFREADAARARAAAALERIGGAPVLAAELDHATGTAAIVRGDLDGADRILTRGLHTAETAHADLRAAAILVALGQIELRRDSGKAAPLFERARAIDVRVLGPDHPDLAAIDIALGSAAFQRDAFADATAHFERAIALAERAVGHVDRDVANALANLALVRQWQGRAGDALVTIREALAIDAQVLPPGDPQTAAHLSGEADVLEQLDRHADALAAIDRALGELHALFGDRDHQDIADALHSRALIELATGKLPAALADARAALAMVTRIDPHLPTAELHRTLGRIELAQHDPRAALADFEGARHEPADAFASAWLDGLYGRALVEAHRDRARGIALVASAYTRMRADGRSDAEWQELATWMHHAGIAVTR